jgi:hypothetical protein
VTRVRGSQGVGDRRIGVSKDRKLSHIGIAIRDFPTGELCGPQREIVEDRCYPYRGSGLGAFRELVQRESRFPDLPPECGPQRNK